MVIGKYDISIFIDDLKDDVKQEMINKLGDDGNYDIIPIAVINIDEFKDSLEEFEEESEYDEDEEDYAWLDK